MLMITILKIDCVEVKYLDRQVSLNIAAGINYLEQINDSPVEFVRSGN